MKITLLFFHWEKKSMCGSALFKKENGTWKYLFVFVSPGKRIPTADTAGATTGKGFKLGRQASESHRTCCWWCRPLSPHDWWPDLFLPSVFPACYNLEPLHTLVFEGVWGDYWGQWLWGHWHRVQLCQPDGHRKCIFAAVNSSKFRSIVLKFLAGEMLQVYWTLTKMNTTFI